MSDDTHPRILIVDDEEIAQYELGINDHIATRARHPNDVESADLDWADLVLMDFQISQWPERDELDGVSLRPLNGLALASVLREHADENRGDGHGYTAFAIHSGHIGDIARRLHTSNKTPQVVARLNNLEWAFDKVDATRFTRSAELAHAVRVVSESWATIETGGLASAATKLLGLQEETDWNARALDDVVLCQIPLSAFSAGTNGLLFLRWLLHGILPYPTFLWASHWVAACLRLTPTSFDRLLEGDSRLAQDLEKCRYSGILDSFLGSRWWRAAIEQYAWGIRVGGAREPDPFHAVLEERAATSLERVEEVAPVVCVDRELKPLDQLRSLEDVVRLVPDLWPAFADCAYAEISAVRDDTELAAIVHPLDRERVAPTDEEE